MRLQPKTRTPFRQGAYCGCHTQEAGADAKLELAFTLADGIEYVRTAVASSGGKISPPQLTLEQRASDRGRFALSAFVAGLTAGAAVPRFGQPPTTSRRASPSSLASA